MARLAAATRSRADLGEGGRVLAPSCSARPPPEGRVERLRVRLRVVVGFGGQIRSDC